MPRDRQQRQRDVLEALAIYNTWTRPMDVGGRDGSHHASTLRALVKKGLAEQRLRESLLDLIRGSALYARLVAGRKRVPRVPRRAYEFQITNAGRKVLAPQ